MRHPRPTRPCSSSRRSRRRRRAAPRLPAGLGRRARGAGQLAYQAGGRARRAGRPDAIRRAERKWLQWGLLDRFEYAARRGQDGYAWDFSALIGGERHRLWLGTSGDGPAWGGPGYVELNALYSYHLGGAWDLNAGLRYDVAAAPEPRLCGARRPI